MKRSYKRQKTNSGDLRTPVQFYEYAPNDGPEAGELEKKVLYDAWAKIDEVWLKDLELAKSTGTLSDVTITMRDPLDDYSPTDLHYFSIDARGFRDKRYNVKHVIPSLQDNNFIVVVGSVSV